MTRRAVRPLVAAAVLTMTTATAEGSGHGPLFGMATPTNPRGGWSVDLGGMGRQGESGTDAMIRGMLGYGVTEDVKVTLSVPLVLASASMPPGRMAAMMPGSGDIEALVAWRVHRQNTGIGTRFETTVYGSLIVPGPQRPAGMAGQLARSPGVFTGVATGVASRSHYLWGGVGYIRFAPSSGDQRPAMLMYSGVWGYRPPALRKDYPHADWRLMIEMTGEHAGAMRHAGQPMPGTAGHQVFVGPSVLGLLRNHGISAGIQFPVYRDQPRAQPRERFRYGVNVSWFF